MRGSLCDWAFTSKAAMVDTILGKSPGVLHLLLSEIIYPPNYGCIFTSVRNILSLTHSSLHLVLIPRINISFGK